MTQCQHDWWTSGGAGLITDKPYKQCIKCGEVVYTDPPVKIVHVDVDRLGIPPFVPPDSKITKAVEFAVRFGQIDGAHHKAWVIDQMVRALCGCPVEWVDALDCNGKPYRYAAQVPNKTYNDLIAFHSDGGNYEWSEGTPP